MPAADSPGFIAVQRQFAAHIRNPQSNPAPPGIEARRMRIYVDLFHRNIRKFLDNGFPVARAALGTVRWRELTDAFYDRHGSETPYFLDIGQEFLAFLDELSTEPGMGPDGAPEPLPGWLLELCHYEWVKRSLRSANPEIPTDGIDPGGDLLTAAVVVSPLVRPLCYRYRVQQIDAQGIPQGAPDGPAWLLACRRRDDSVTFIQSNALTHRLLELLAGETTGNDALAALAAEHARLDGRQLRQQGAATLERLRDAQVLLGVRSHRTS